MPTPQENDHVTRQVQTLLAAKVPPERITVIGFSKGGGIATRTSALLKNDKVNFVFLAACGDGSFRGVDRDVRGRILSAARKWSDIRAQKFTPEELRQIDQEIESELLEMDLRALREAVGLTQGELAQRVEITQSQLSKMERREDHRISTLRRYVEALGGSLEICAVIDGKRIKLAEVKSKLAGA